ncbi:MAG: adenylosuccinate synthetase [Actinomycetota bacterium]|nr:adenylosuccinate synthetase [Actinomycetota bacterium]
MGAIVIVDALWGDSGKGKTCAHLARRLEVPLAVRAGVGTNAGASVHLDDGREVRARQLPTGWLHPGTTVAVGSGVLVDPVVFADEVAGYGLEGRAVVDRRCAVIEPHHIAAEADDSHLVSVVGSTVTGNGHARASFALRRARQARDVPELEPYVGDVVELANRVARTSTVLVEGSQGTQLSLALSDDYPCTTSDNCTTAAALDDVGLNWQLLSEVVLVVKALPTRVGTGPLPYEMSHAEAEARGIAEYGVVTGRPRRKASAIDWDLLDFACTVNGPTQIALTFCDHVDPNVTGARHRDELTAPVRTLIAEVERRTGVPVTLVDTGKLLTHMVDLP